MKGNRCIHEFLPGQCDFCRPEPGREPAPADTQVWTLPTGEVFHRADCYILDATHESNIVRNSTDTPPEAASVADAIDRGLRPCEICSPQVR